ncbi:VOC family protein [Bdellovibrio svalbardensis]|uniref:VOC family protein n=1 Tax=Bdellovibrio svalbardensis TaxID=2972972 RepID=A0ABT6DFA2_9BACT|nr:VOC family protein [Bdellovibrio svalbardensis]MDG0815147.1 VOC family protein [Bdellovibrio svalbardensis]
MSFKIQEVTAIRIFSNDIQKSRDWYEALFNLEPIEDLDFFVSFKIGGACFDITLPDAKNPFSQGGSVGYWLVDDIDAVLKKVEELGGKLYRGPLKVSETQRTIMQVQDPFGNVIGFEANTL